MRRPTLYLHTRVEREREGAQQLAELLENTSIYQCDISSDGEIDRLFEIIKEKYGVIHGVVHGIAHAKREDIQNDFVNTSRDGFAHAMDISAYSLVAVCKRAKELMSNGGSIVTLTYMGSEKVFPGYNVMGVAKAALEASVRYLAYDLGKYGIRVNAISAGPIKTISSKAIKDFGSILSVFEDKVPLKKSLEQDELGDSATLPSQRPVKGSYRGSHTCGLRIQYYGHLVLLFAIGKERLAEVREHTIHITY